MTATTPTSPDTATPDGPTLAAAGFDDGQARTLRGEQV